MWFRFPKGVERVSVERQEFSVDATDAEGLCYFRAPEHFATRILAINGFAAVDKPPEGAPADLPRADPLRDGSIAELTKSTEAYKINVANLTSDLAVANAKILALTSANAALSKQLVDSEGEREKLQDELENKPAVAPQAAPSAKAK